MKAKVLMNKGEHGYIGFMKKRTLIGTTIMFGIAIGIFMLGLALNNFEKGNIFTIIAAVMVIPAARVLTAFILFSPFSDAGDDECALVEKTAKPGSVIYTDVVITSEQKAMGLKFIVITGSKVIMLKSREKDKADKINDYVESIVKRRGYDYKVTTADDMTRFTNLLKSSDCVNDLKFGSEKEKETFENERNELMQTLESIMA